MHRRTTRHRGYNVFFKRVAERVSTHARRGPDQREGLAPPHPIAESISSNPGRPRTSRRVLGSLCALVCALPSLAAQTPPVHIVSPDGATGERFAHGVAMNKDSLIVGSWLDWNGGSTGSVYRFDRNGSFLPSEMVPASPAGYCEFGYEVAATDELIVVSAHFSTGRVYVFDAVSGVELYSISPPANAGKSFSQCVDVDGDYLIASAHYADEGAGYASGAAYVFHAPSGQLVSVLTASNGVPEDRFGYRVALDGNRAIVGSAEHDYSGVGQDSGAAYVYDILTGQELFVLQPNDAVAGMNFGQDVAISGDRAIVGGRWSAVGGAAYVFDLTTGLQLRKLTPSDGQQGDQFGVRLDLHGSLTLIGSPFHDAGATDAGAAYLFDAQTGHQLCKLVSPHPKPGDLFGQGIAFDGEYGLVGAMYSDGQVANSGSAYLFNLSAYSLEARGWTRKNYDLGGTSHYPYPSIPNTGQVGLIWQAPAASYARVLTTDLDDDGVLDIIAADGVALTAYDGSGSILWSTSTTAQLTYTGDVDSDGRPEVLVCSRSGADLIIDVYDHDGFLQKSLVRCGSGYDSNVRVMGHVGSRLIVTYGAGYSLDPRGVGIWDYNLGTEVSYYCGAGSIWGDVAFGDPDLDSKLEVALPWGTPHNGAACNGMDDGNLYGALAELDLVAGTSAGQSSSPVTSWNQTTNPNGMLSGLMVDLDGDGVEEIFFRESHDGVSYPGQDFVYEVGPSGNLLSLWVGEQTGGYNLMATVINDVNGDDVRELVFSPMDGPIQKLYLVDGASQSTLLTQTDAGRVLGSCDFDGDGADELIVYHVGTPNEIRVYDGGSLAVESSTPVDGMSTWHTYNRFCISDVTGDGMLDLVLGGVGGVTVLSSQFMDCNGNGIPDGDDIASGFSSDNNSNGVPDECECGASNFCDAAANSGGVAARIGSTGAVSIAANSFRLTAHDAKPLQFGLFFYSQNEQQHLWGEGMLCIGPKVCRIFPILHTDGTGYTSLPIDFTKPPFDSGPFGITPFSTWNFQFWYRDPMGGPKGFNFSDALKVIFCL